MTRAQDDKLGRQLEIVDFMQPQKTVLRFATLVHQRENNAGELRVFAVKQTVRGKMNNPVKSQLAAFDCGAASFKVETFDACAFRNKVENAVCLAACPIQTGNARISPRDAGFLQSANDGSGC